MANELQTHMAMKIPFHTMDGREFFIGPYTMTMIVQMHDWTLRRPLRELKKEFDSINKGEDDGLVDLETVKKMREDAFKEYLARKCKPIDLGELWDSIFSDSENIVEFFRMGLAVNHPDITTEETAELITEDTLVEIVEYITQANGLPSVNPTNPMRKEKQGKQRSHRKTKRKKMKK